MISATHLTGSSSRTVAHKNDPPAVYTELQKNDVLLGRGTGPNEYEGNVRFRKIVRDTARSYVVLDPKNKNKELSTTKTAFARRVVDQVANRGGRFLRKLSKEETKLALKGMFRDDGLRPAGFLTRNRDFYVEVSKSIAIEKAKQSLRHHKRMTQPQQVRVVGRAACFQTKGSITGGTATRIMLTSSSNNKAAGSRPSTTASASSSWSMLGDNNSPVGATIVPTRRVNSSSGQRRGGEHAGAAILLSAAAAVDAGGGDECRASGDGVLGPNKKTNSITTTLDKEEDTKTGGQATSSCSGGATNSLSTTTTTNGRKKEEDHPPLSASLRESTTFYHHDPFKNPASHDLLLSQQQHHSLMMPPPAPTVLPASLPLRVSFFLNPSRMSSYYHPRPCCAHADADASTDSSLPFTATTAALMRTRRAVLASSSSYYAPAAINFVASGEPSLVERTAALAEDTNTNTALRQFLGSSSLFLPPAGAGAGAAIFPSPSLLGRIDSLIYPGPTPSSAVTGFGYGSPPAEQQQAALLNYLLCSGTNNPHY